MTASLATLALLFVFSVLLALPLVPAYLEFLGKSDAAPLDVIQQHAGDIRFFAEGFRSYLGSIAPTMQDCLASGKNVTVAMPDGDSCMVLGHGEGVVYVPAEKREPVCSSVIASAADLQLPAETAFEKDIYSRGQFVGGNNSQYRAILGERDVHLLSGTTVTRWVHGVGKVTAEPDCKLYGRISSEQCIRLDAGCSFSRLNAPRIELGPLGEDDTAGGTINSANTVDAHPLTRLVHDGDFEVPAGEVFRGHLVVRGKLRIGSGASIFGSVKAEKDLVLEDNAEVTGSLITTGVLRIGRRCSVHGPVIAERAAYLEAGSRCGTPQGPTTVSAPRIEVAEGALVFGTLWAREIVQVVTQ